MPFQRLLESRALISAFCFIGTIAPSRSGWWRELVEGGSTGSTYVQLLQGDVKRDGSEPAAYVSPALVAS